MRHPPFACSIRQTFVFGIGCALGPDVVGILIVLISSHVTLSGLGRSCTIRSFSVSCIVQCLDGHTTGVEGPTQMREQKSRRCVFL